MSSHELLIHGPDDAAWTLLLTHGAGAPASSPLLESVAAGLGERGVRVIRFEFPYMAARRETGRRRPPDRAAVLLETWAEQVRRARSSARLLAIGGHSMGGRYASMLAADASPQSPAIDAVVAIGYPFRPPQAAEPRVAHLAGLQSPMLIVQGTRDPFGSRDDVAGWAIPAPIRFSWIPDGDHALVPRRSSGRSSALNYAAAADAIRHFLDQVQGNHASRAGS